MASISVPCPKISSTVRVGLNSNQKHTKISFANALNPHPNPSLSLGSSCFQCRNKPSAPWKVHAQISEVSVEESLNSARVLDSKSKVASSEGKNESTEKTVPDAAAISAFMTQVSDLVKLVDSRDIMELQMKQLDCELIIRKKEAMQQPVPAAPVYTMPPPIPHATYSSPPPAAAPASPPTSAPVPALPAPAKTAQSTHPPLKCPMAGTFYRCPGPGEPPFVKVGDKVQKGQVICIIEAMKLMNEIEADQSGTIADVLIEDGKPVSVDTPLFVIVP
ncbi:Biotin_lipoyl domain-containing protein [Cephalotus follicularis]|uniref:Biotin carboxyl carrier protein of acetyl-CoA carboxylase n=1 Tax=Cephalotus follicularis TaxID=3775 RepID=A0A1Q3BCQ7_CEPFO|nr:Biotin_lipoyl domain-containing protein [Cephalotus follicularis]